MITTDRTLWIHGWGTSAQAWTPFVGQTPPSPRFCSEDLVDDVIKSAHTLEPEILVGWSLGGMLAIAAAAELASLQKLILFGCAPSFCRREDQPGWPPSIVQRMQETYLRSPDLVYTTFLKEHLPEHPFLAGLDDSFGALGLSFLEKADLRSAAAGLTIPVLHVHGELDSLFPCPSESHANAAFASTDVRFHRLDGCGHAPFLDDPQQCESLVNQFLQ